MTSSVPGPGYMPVAGETELCSMKLCLSSSCSQRPVLALLVVVPDCPGVGARKHRFCGHRFGMCPAGQWALDFAFDLDQHNNVQHHVHNSG